MTYEHVDILDPYYLGITAIVTVGYQTIFFIITAIFKFDKVTDFAGGTNFLILSLMTLLFGGTFYPRQIVNSVIVSMWAVRLAGFLLMRILAWGKDNRFDDIRENIIKLIGFWVIQAIWVWTVSLPLTVLNADIIDTNLNGFDYAGWVISVTGFCIEAIADVQKLMYKKQKSKTRWCDAGLWYWSRHPNYFGEMLVWWGLFMSVANILSDWEWLVIVSPLFITLLLLFVSGIPIQERGQCERFLGTELEAPYLQYRKQTSPLIPIPPIIYEKIPGPLKLFLFEFPFYKSSPKYESVP